jgi:hypothetical protein
MENKGVLKKNKDAVSLTAAGFTDRPVTPCEAGAEG